MRQIIASHDLKALFGSTRRDAQELLPQLVRRLVLASCEDNELPNFRMPAGDDIRLHGWDGVLTYTGVHPWIPTGASVWEMSVSEAIEERAEENFTKRKKDPLGADPNSTSFVFVTPLVWAGKDAWVGTKRTERVWADVRVIDGSDLATWLERTPVVALWIADALARSIRGLDSSNRYWEKTLTNQYSARVTPHVLIAGRSKEADALRNWLQSPSDAISIVGETTEEAVVFAAAVLRDIEQNSKGQEQTSRLLFVSDSASAEHLATLSHDHIAVLTEPGLFSELHAASLKHLHLVIPEKRDARVNSGGASIQLGQLVRSEVTKALEQAGVTKAEAERIASESKGSLQAVLWMIAQPERGALSWGSGRTALELAPLVLAGQWMIDEHADHEVIGQLAQRPYSEIRHTLAEWSGPGKPLERRGAIWDWKAWAFAWKRFAPALTATDIDRFAKIVLEVLGMPDPALELPPEDRWLANIRGKVHKYSPALRKGLVDSVLLTAINSSAVPGVDGQAVANGIVRRLLSGDQRTQKWLSVARWLPEMAEAAPDAFLSTLDEFIGDKNAVQAMFTEGGIFGSSPHVYVLWALERLAWSSDHFSRTVLALGALAEVDPGGQLSNRPLQSLRMLFLPWLPATSAVVNERSAALRLLFDRFNDVAWKCAVSVLPKSHDVGNPIVRPKWRAWAPDRERRPSHRDYWSFQEQLIDMLISQAGIQADRWATLLHAAPTLLGQNGPLGEKVLNAILTLDPTAFSSSDLSVLGESARQLVMHHENMPDADWSLKSEALEPFKRIMERFKPRTPIDQHRWLFARSPEILREYELSLDDRNAKLEKERVQALDEVMSDGGMAAVIGWSRSVEYPESIGHALALTSLPQDDERALLLDTFENVGARGHRSPEAQFGYGYVWRKAFKDDNWSSATLTFVASRLKPADLAFFCQALPPRLFTWGLIEKLTLEVQDLYWSEVFLNVLSLDECEVACPRLLKARRPFAVIDLIGMLFHGVKSDKDDGTNARITALTWSVLDSSIEHLPKDESPPVGANMIAHHIDAAIGFVEKHGASDDELAKWEWQWLPFIEDERRGLKSLQNQLNGNPSLFVDLLTCVFKARDGSDDDVGAIDEQAKLRAHFADKLLEAWTQVPAQSASAQETPDNAIDEGMRPAVPAYVGTVDAARLADWVTEARRLADEAKRLEVCDHRIGRQFAYAPADTDGSWPCSAVREVIEAVRNEDIEHGLVLGVMNRQGAHFVGKDGALEAKLATRFRDWCEKVRTTSPRTGAVLRQLADHYERQGQREIERGRLEEYDM